MKVCACVLALVSVVDVAAVDESPQDVLGKHLTALGGKDRITAIRSGRVMGSLSLGTLAVPHIGGGSVQFDFSGQAYRLDVSLGPFSVTVGFDGTRRWTSSMLLPGSNRRSEWPGELLLVSLLTYRYGTNPLWINGLREPRLSQNGGEWLVDYAWPAGIQGVLRVDAHTWLIAGIEMEVPGEVSLEAFISSYQILEGTVVPKNLLIKDRQNGLAFGLSLTHVVINPAIPHERFEPPSISMKVEWKDPRMRTATMFLEDVEGWPTVQARLNEDSHTQTLVVSTFDRGLRMADDVSSLNGVKVRLSGVSVSDVPVAPKNHGDALGPSVAGYMGVAGLDGVDMSIDGLKRQMVWSSQIEGGQIIRGGSRMILRGGVPCLELSLKGAVPAVMAISTGTKDELVIFEDSVNRLGFRHEAGVVVVPRLALGGKEFLAVRARVIKQRDQLFDGWIGWGLLKQCTMKLLFSQRKIVFGP